MYALNVTKCRVYALLVTTWHVYFLLVTTCHMYALLVTCTLCHDVLPVRSTCHDMSRVYFGCHDMPFYSPLVTTGHVYAIGECGGAMQESQCPECGETVGGLQHRLTADNSVATEMDGAMHGAWSEQANLANYENLH